MHDLLYQNQNSWKDSTNAPKDFEAFATQLGLDMTKYRADFASAETNAIIAADIATGQAKKITGTPTFFLDDKQIEDNNSVATFEKFSKLIDSEILAKTGKPPTTAPTVIPTGQVTPAQQ